MIGERHWEDNKWPDTEFAAKDEWIISTNIIRKEDIDDESSSALVLEASIHNLSTQNEDENNNLGQDEPNSAPATQRTSSQSPSAATQHNSNQSPSPSNQRTANQWPAVATQCIADQSPAAVVADVLPISHPNLVFLLQLLYPKTPRNGSKAWWSKTKRKRKRSTLNPTSARQTRKRAVSGKAKTKQRRKNPIRPKKGIGRIKESLWRKRNVLYRQGYSSILIMAQHPLIYLKRLQKWMNFYKSL